MFAAIRRASIAHLRSPHKRESCGKGEREIPQ